MMQPQLDAQAAKSRAQRNLGSMAQHPTTEALLTRQPGLSMNAPVFVPGQGPGMSTTFYNSTPHANDQTQQMGSVSRSMDGAEPVNVYTPFQKLKPIQ